ncbi:MAG: hypothetical protein QF893_17310 [Alphaproteobacteria bacterium]|nr:hypothetical protein [Alphaproteobacteria bacterium]
MTAETIGTSSRNNIIGKHVILAVVQYGFLALLALGMGAFESKMKTLQFLGHVGPSTLLIASGVAAMLMYRQPRRLVRREGHWGLVAALLYVAGDTFISHPPFGIFNGAGNAEQQHVGFMMLIGAMAVYALVLEQRLERPTGLHVAVPVVAFGLLILAHGQHNDVAFAAHWGSAIFAVVAAFFRLFGRLFEYGVSIIIAGYLFTSGQMGYTMFATSIRIDGVAWVCYWTAFAVLVAMTYVLVFRGRPAAPSDQTE